MDLVQLTNVSLHLKPGWHLELAQPSTSTLQLKTRLALGLGPAFNFITSIPCSGGGCVPRAIHFPSFLWDSQVSGTEDLVQLFNFLQRPMGPLFLITAAAVSSFTGGTVASGPSTIFLHWRDCSIWSQLLTYFFHMAKGAYIFNHNSCRG